MIYYDEQLSQLQEQKARKVRLEGMIRKLENQRIDLEKRVLQLEVEKEMEQEDVDRLEGKSLANFFYRFVGKQEEKLEKERREAYEAAIKYDAAASELAAVKFDLQKYRAELSRLFDCDERYAKLLAEKADAIKASDTPFAEKILKLEERISYLKSQIKEIEEAIHAGEEAGRIAEVILSELDSAKGWGTWDLLGGGFVSDLVKHSHLDQAQSQVEKLQIQLTRFRTELNDVAIEANMQVNIDGFLRFADYFFDGIFADWTVLNRIGESLDKVRDVKSQIGDMLDKLSKKKNAIEGEINRSKAELEQTVMKTPV